MSWEYLIYNDEALDWNILIFLFVCLSVYNTFFHSSKISLSINKDSSYSVGSHYFSIYSFVELIVFALLWVVIFVIVIEWVVIMLVVTFWVVVIVLLIFLKL